MLVFIFKNFVRFFFFSAVRHGPPSLPRAHCDSPPTLPTTDAPNPVPRCQHWCALWWRGFSSLLLPFEILSPQNTGAQLSMSLSRSPCNWFSVWCPLLTRSLPPTRPFRRPWMCLCIPFDSPLFLSLMLLLASRRRPKNVFLSMSVLSLVYLSLCLSHSSGALTRHFISFCVLMVLPPSYPAQSTQNSAPRQFFLTFCSSFCLPIVILSLPTYLQAPLRSPISLNP